VKGWARRSGLMGTAVGLSAAAVALAGCSSGSSRAVQAPGGATSAAVSTVSATVTPTPAVATAPAVAPAPTAARSGSAAPSSTAPPPTTAPAATVPSTPAVVPTSSPAGSKITDPAAAAYEKWQPIEDEAYFRLEGNYPPLVAISTPNRITFEVSDLAAHKKAGDHQVGLTHGVVIGVATASPTRKTLRVCQSLASGYWVDKAGKRLSKPKTKWQADMVAMVLVDGVWKVDSLYAGTFSCKALS
jgi:hypothetical protein